MQDFRPGHHEPIQQLHLSQAPDAPEAAARPLPAPSGDVRIFENGVAPDVFDDEEVLELASPWRRIAARLLDCVPFAFIGVFAAVIVPALQNRGDSAGAAVSVMLAAFLAVSVYQLVIMSRDGQSIGKKLMAVRVVNADGENPGFVRYVLVRELAYNFIVQLIGVLPLLGPIVVIGASGACLFMLFSEERDRRTLQDLLANTFVVKV